VLVFLTYVHRSGPLEDGDVVSEFTKNLFLSLLFLFSALYYRNKIDEDSGLNFTETIWNAFITAALMFIPILMTRLFDDTVIGRELLKYPLYVNIIYHFNIVFITIFSIKTFYTFRKLILYQKSKGLMNSWKIFEGLILLSLLLNVVDLPFSNPANYVFIGALGFYGLALSLNLKWVAYLNFRQKWQSILLLFLLLLITASFVQYIYIYSVHNKGQFGLFDTYDHHYLLNDMGQKVFIIVLFIFITFYCLSSILVLLFNLPTSSVFEQKLGEVFNFQRLSQTIRMSDSEHEIHDILIETSMSTVMADAAWLEIINDKGNYTGFLNKGIEKYDVFEIKKAIKKNGIRIGKDYHYTKNIKSLKHNEKIKKMGFHSILIIPLHTPTKYLGLLALIKKVDDGFDKEILEVVNSFASQATVSIENSRLLKEAIEHERYREEIKIARTVQQSLLPKRFSYNSAFQISIFTESADEVGGDYYDAFQISEHRTAIVIADVSGHGTSAAFNMAQLKGVFQSLIQLKYSPEKTIMLANHALSNCLPKKTFITLTLYEIDTENKKILFSRAGHCPTLYYNKAQEKALYFQNKGLGLGILRSAEYEKYSELFIQSYDFGDIMVMYTDGIIEAKDAEGNEFGYERLRLILEENADQNATQIMDHIKAELYKFCGTKDVGDDHTCLVLKFV
jgi:serine phosphatase RsbU (regulator of sigma subunit)